MIVALRVLVKAPVKLRFFFFFTSIFVSSEPVSLTLTMHICNALWAPPLQASGDAAISKFIGFIPIKFEPTVFGIDLRQGFLVFVCFFF